MCVCVCCVLKAGEGWGRGPRSWAEGWRVARGQGGGRQPDRGAITAGSSGQDQAVSWTIHLQSRLRWGDASPSSNFTRQWRFKVKASPGLLWPFLTEQLLKQAPCSSRRAWLKGPSHSSISGILYWLIKIITKKKKTRREKEEWRALPILERHKWEIRKNWFSTFYQRPSHTLKKKWIHFLICRLHEESLHPAPLDSRRRCTLLIHLNTIYWGSTSTVRRHKITWSVLIVSSTN